MAAKRYTRKSARSRAHARRGTIRLGLVLAVLIGVNLYVFLWRGGTSIPEVRQAAMAAESAPASLGGGDDEPGAEIPPAPTGALPEGDEAPSEQGAWVDGAVGKGDSLGRLLRRHGLDPQQIDEVVRTLRDHMDFRSIRVGQEYRIHTRDDGAVEEFEFEVSKTEKVVARRDPAGQLVGEKVEAETQIVTHWVGGTIRSSLNASMKQAGEEASLVGFMVDIFAYDLNFYIDQHKGDTFRMLVEKEYLDGKFLRYQAVRAAEYSGKAGTFRAFYWKSRDGKVKGYFDEEGRSIARTFLKTPLKYSRVSSKFNKNRMHPVLHKKRAHLGVDYAAATGTPIWAAASGKIVQRGWGGGAGNRVEIDHGNGYRTVYMHMVRFRKGQNVGDHVRQKTVIGYVGSTGLATGAHLHFGVKHNGRYIDPMSMKMARGAGVPKAYQAAFHADVDQLVTRLALVPTGGGDDSARTAGN